VGLGVVEGEEQRGERSGEEEGVEGEGGVSWLWERVSWLWERGFVDIEVMDSGRVADCRV